MMITTCWIFGAFGVGVVTGVGVTGGVDDERGLGDEPPIGEAEDRGVGLAVV
jgi:hypothetical protein